MQPQASDLGLLITLAMAALSARLFRIGWRTRSLPELLVGIHFLLAPIAISLSIRVERFDPAHAEAVRATISALFTVASSSLLWFGWRVFRPRLAIARAGAWAGLPIFAGIWARDLAAGGFAAGAGIGLSTLVYAPYLWVFAESLAYHRRMRRRLGLGLADPVTTNRFLLFAIWTGGVVAITLLGLLGVAVAELGGGGKQEMFSNPVILALTRIVTLPVAVSIWLAFFPPRRYCGWLERRAPQPASS